MANIRVDGLPLSPGVALTDNLHTTQGGVDYKATLQSIYDAIKYEAVPAGQVFSVAWNADPATLGHKALLLQGQGIIRANYPELDTAVYVGDGNNATASAFYRATDSGGVTRSTTGTYLILPDARGRMIRGLDLAGSIDPDGASRDLGSYQDDSIQGHAHTFFQDGAGGASKNPNTLNNGDGLRALEVTPRPVVGGAITDALFGSSRVSTETRSVNIALNHVITY